MKYFIALFIGLMTTLCFAQTIYQQTDTQGNMTYTDSPSQNAKAIILPNASPPAVSTPSSAGNATTPAATPAISGAPSVSVSDADTQHVPYTAMTLTSPIDQETFQNQRLIPVAVQLTPDLQQGDKVQLYVDNALYGTPVADINLALNQLDRGSHTVSAMVIDKNNVALKSTKTITIFVQYARLGTGVP